MPIAEIITIGTEILLGEIVDTNARYIARQLRDNGIDLYRTTTVGDNIERIVQAIQQALQRTDIIVTTGGLGPTVDDPTRDAIAQAVGVETEFRPELWEQIQARFQRFNRVPTENNKKQAYIPKGAIARENPVGTAPIFIVEPLERSIIALPGVPREMEYLLEHTVLPYLRERYQLSEIIKTRVLHTAGVGESQIDDIIGDLERLKNPTVGLAAHSGQVDIRITVKARSDNEAEELIKPIETDLRERMGAWIYGADHETLESIALRHLSDKGFKLVVIEAGLGGELTRRLASLSSKAFNGSEVLPTYLSKETLSDQLKLFSQQCGAEIGLGVTIQKGKEKQEVEIILLTPDGEQFYQRPYGGPPEYAPRWAMHHSLDVLRTL
jgi:nicotinamide-nucleotide amidase